MTDKKLFLGVDIGGTKTAMVITDESLCKLASREFKTQPRLGAPSLCDRIAATYDEMLAEAGLSRADITAAGVASPGPLDLPAGKIVFIATMGFCDVPLVDMLTERLGLPVYLENDTNAAVIYESAFGAGKGYDTVAYVTVSTGIGCGIYANGRVLDGAHSAAGEFGHIIVERGGKSCGCGGRGCLEMYASGTSIAEITSGRLGRNVNTKEAFDLAREGNPVAVAVIDEACDHLGYALSMLYQTIDPGIIVFGGSVTKDFDYMEEKILAATKKYTEHIPGREIRFAITSLQGEQTVFGAAHYANVCSKA